MSEAADSARDKPPKVGTPQWIEDQVQQYLRSGDHDMMFAGWPGMHFLDAARQGTIRLQTALVEEVLRRTPGVECQVCIPKHLARWTRDKLAPMVHGLFGSDERPVVLDMFERSVVFLTPWNIAEVLRKETWLSTAWDLANLYLCSLKLPGLSEQARHIVGLSQEMTCYVAMSYFDEDDPFADFVVHEAAHVFHNCKRETLGLAQTRRREWLLEIDYVKRETFAYACESYSRISSTAGNPRQRLQALEQHALGPLPPDDRVDHGEYLDILGEAVRARNGWQRILKRCAPSRVRRPSVPMTT
ncbi:MAG: hypothetical protein HUU30_11695 [Burkholderiaceae bacterium]|nr:hypothetical protein [Burkholderiaceae bacterium]